MWLSLVNGILVTRMQAETWEVCVPFHFSFCRIGMFPFACLPSHENLLGQAGWKRHMCQNELVCFSWPQMTEPLAASQPDPWASPAKRSNQPKSLIHRIRKYRNGYRLKQLRFGVVCYAAKATWYTNIPLIYLLAMCTVFLPQLHCEPQEGRDFCLFCLEPGS